MITANQAKDIATDDSSVKIKLLEKLSKTIAEAANLHQYTTTFNCSSQYREFIEDNLRQNGYKYRWHKSETWKDETFCSYFEIDWS